MDRVLFLGWLGLLGVNALSFAQFGWDKRRAEFGLWRIPEDRLLLTALLGGWVGAYLGRAHFRHKTRKQPFGSQLFAASFCNVMAMTGAAVWCAAT